MITCAAAWAKVKDDGYSAATFHDNASASDARRPEPLHANGTMNREGRASILARCAGAFS
jgi:hypothetical protein